MRIKHLFYLLLALPLVFTACDKGSEDTDKAPELKPVLTLTSKATMEVAAEAGDYEITYTAKMEEVTRNSPAPEYEPEVACEAEWITIGEFDFTKAAFSVAANDGEAREAKIVVTYSTERFEVTVKQVAKGEEPAPDPVLTLTSNEVMEFTAEGGNGEITYTLENAVEGVELEATCEAAWVSNVTVDEKVTFNVAANEGEAREAKVVVKYDTESFEVTVKQAAKVVEAPTYLFDVAMLAAERMTAEDLEMELEAYDFPILFVNEAFSAMIHFVGAEEDTVLQAGTYTNKDFGIYLSSCIATDDAENLYTFTAVEATVELEGEVYSFDVVMTDKDGYSYHFVYEGEVDNMTPAVVAPEVFEPVKVEAYRESSYETGNFGLRLYVDDAYYHELDIFDKVAPNNNYLSAGKYSTADGSIGKAWSTFYKGNDQTCKIADAEITLTINDDNSVAIVGYVKSEEGHNITVDWTGTVEGFNFETGGDNVSFTAQYFTCEHCDYDGVYNYYITLSDAAEEDVLGAAYYRFDLYSATLDTDNPRVPVGTYAFDIEDSYADGTMGVSYTYMEMKTTDGVVVWLGSEGGTLTVTETGIEATINYDDGSTHTITYTGDLSIELPEPEPISSLTADVAVNVTNATIVTSACYGDIYGTGAQYWLINIMEDATYGNGVYVQLDLLATSNESYVGTYTASNQFGAGTFTPGIVGDYGNASSWYYHQQYYVKDTWAPLADGTITVTDNGDGTKSFTFDCTDGLGHAVKGTIVAR
ncbi:MAG: BACON domain-containing protein [Alistipes sp.]|nr:BACON domain-containing protein [Alistipes sp.]